MKDREKTKEELINELEVLRKEIAQNEASKKERTHCKEVLRETKERYRHLFQHFGEAIFVTNQEGKCVEVNQSFLDLFGYTREEIGDLNVERIYVNPEARSRLQQEMEHKGAVREFAVRLRTKDGAEIDCLLTASGRKSGDGNTMECQGIIRDISEQKALLEIRRKYEFIVNTSQQFMTLISKEYRYEAVNAAYCVAHKKTPDQLVGRTVTEVWGNENFKQAIMPYLAKCFCGEELHHRQWFEFGDHKQRCYDVSYYPYYGNSETVTHVVVITHDITEAEKAELALRESEEKYRLLVENASDAIFIVQDELIKFPNPRTEEMLGYSAEKLTKIFFADLIYPEDRDMVLDRQRKRLSNEAPSGTLTFRITNRAGEALWVQLNDVVITWGGYLATLNSLRDITPQKKLEAQLQQAQKMEALGTLAGGIAHNFNNLLMGIMGNASLVLLETHPESRHHERLQNIERLVDNGSKLTRQLLGYAREGQYEVKPLSLNQLANETSDTLAKAKREIRVHQELAEDLWGINADQAHIEQALLNLYINAADAMPAGGDLFVKTMNVSYTDMNDMADKPKTGNYVMVAVTDTGIGMDKKTRDRIFDPFFTTKGLSNGTGLGLASVYGTIKAHGGYIDVDSKKGKGTTFRIYLPASQLAPYKETGSLQKTVGGTETVLFVDDEDMIISVASALLEKTGYNVLPARGGKEAVHIYNENRNNIDIVILDMIMPDMGGKQTYALLKEINPAIKVLLSSGYSIDGQASEILQQGCDGFIQKPFNMRQLSNKMREILDRR